MKKIIKIALVAGAACLAGKLLLSAVAPKIDVTVVADRWDPDPDTGKDEDDAPVDSAEQNAAPEPEAETSVSEESAPAPESGEVCEADAAEGDVAHPADADAPADAEPAEEAPKAEARASRRQNKAKAAKENADAE